MNKYEQLIEYIINDEEDKARELFHNIVVEQGTKIYESLVNEEEHEEEDLDENQVEELVDEITLDEQGITEEDEEGMEDLGAMDQDEEGEEQGEEELEPRVDALEDALDELKAEFDALMAGEEQEEEMFPGIHGDEGEEQELPEGTCKEEDEMEEDMEEDMDESIVREYVEKVGHPANQEGAAVGAGKSVPVNKKSTVAGKNDMGGTAVDVTKGGTVDPNGNRPHADAKVKGQLIGKNHSTPGANAGKAFSTKEAAAHGEGQTTHGSVPVHAKSPVAK